MYTYPEMPLTVNVWFLAPAVPPGPGGEAQISASISPVRPEDWFRAKQFPNSLQPTHIIRCPPDDRFTDNLLPDQPNLLFPATVLEYPIGSDHYYVVLFAHQVGAGFPNWHSRLFAARYPLTTDPPLPLFQGWV